MILQICAAAAVAAADPRHFVAADVGPSIESASRIGGPGVASMADMVDVVAGAFSGEQSRVSKAVADLAHGEQTMGPSSDCN